MQSCPPCKLSEHERKAVATMRHLAMVAMRGGKVTIYLDKDGRWKVRETITR